MPSMLLIDDHVMFLEGITLALARAMPDMVVHAVSTGQDAFAVLEEHPDIDLAMSDLYMPDIAGAALLRELCRLRRGLRILVVSASNDPADIQCAIRAGAHGFMTKTFDSRTLLDALASVRAGQNYLPEAYGTAGGDHTRADETALLSRLTQRQITVLRLVCGGLRNSEISQRLGTSEKTVKAHVSAILATLDVSNRTHAALIARRGGLLGKFD